MGNAAETGIQVLGMYRRNQNDQGNLKPTADELAGVLEDVLREAVARDPDLSDLFDKHLLQFTEKQAYDLGLKDGREAAERGEPLSMGMTWDEDGSAVLNASYDRGVYDAQKALTLAYYSDASAQQNFGRWDINLSSMAGVVENKDSEAEAWEEAAAKVGLRLLMLKEIQHPVSPMVRAVGVRDSASAMPDPEIAVPLLRAVEELPYLSSGLLLQRIVCGVDFGTLTLPYKNSRHFGVLVGKQERAIQVTLDRLFSTGLMQRHSFPYVISPAGRKYLANNS